MNIIDPQKIDGFFRWDNEDEKNVWWDTNRGKALSRLPVRFRWSTATYNEDDIFICRDGIEVYLK